jgi:hypothetical protein
MTCHGCGKDFPKTSPMKLAVTADGKRHPLCAPCAEKVRGEPKKAPPASEPLPW